MPFTSLKQEAWAHTPTGEAKLGGAAKVAEWDAATKGRKLPTYAPSHVGTGAEGQAGRAGGFGYGAGVNAARIAALRGR